MFLLRCSFQVNVGNVQCKRIGRRDSTKGTVNIFPAGIKWNIDPLRDITVRIFYIQQFNQFSKCYLIHTQILQNWSQISNTMISRQRQIRMQETACHAIHVCFRRCKFSKDNLLWSIVRSFDFPFVSIPIHDSSSIKTFPSKTSYHSGHLRPSSLLLLSSGSELPVQSPDDKFINQSRNKCFPRVRTCWEDIWIRSLCCYLLYSHCDHKTDRCLAYFQRWLATVFITSSCHRPKSRAQCLK